MVVVVGEQRITRDVARFDSVWRFGRSALSALLSGVCFFASTRSNYIFTTTSTYWTSVEYTCFSNQQENEQSGEGTVYYSISLNSPHVHGVMPLLNDAEVEDVIKKDLESAERHNVVLRRVCAFFYLMQTRGLFAY